MRKNYTKTYHIIFDAFGVSSKLLWSERFVLEMLFDIPKLIGMRILAGPNLVTDQGNGHEGVSGFTIVNFSHISIHTFPRTREIFIDIFSCRSFDYPKARRYLYRKLKVTPKDVETLEVKYPWE